MSRFLLGREHCLSERDLRCIGGIDKPYDKFTTSTLMMLNAMEDQCLPEITI